MHLSKLFNIHTYTQHVTWKPIQAKTTRCSSFGIGMRKQMHLLFVHKAIDSVQALLFYLYKLISLSCSLFFSIFISLLYSYSAICTHPGSTRPSLSICALSYRSTTLMHSTIQSYLLKIGVSYTRLKKHLKQELAIGLTN